MRSKPYAGAPPFPTPYGRIATPNLTPDGATGIGGWSLADFTRAVRWGVAGRIVWAWILTIPASAAVAAAVFVATRSILQLLS